MSVYSTQQQLAKILRQLMPSPLGPGQLTKVFDVTPLAVQDADCPAIVIPPGRALYDTTTMSKQIKKTDRLWTVDYLFFAADSQLPGESQNSIEGVIDIIGNFLLARPGLYDTGVAVPDNVEFDSTVLGDEGYVQIPFAKKLFVGTRFNLQIVTLERIIYKD